jgi:hypothetical protein
MVLGLTGHSRLQSLSVVVEISEEELDAAPDVVADDADLLEGEAGHGICGPGFPEESRIGGDAGAEL